MSDVLQIVSIVFMIIWTKKNTRPVNLFYQKLKFKLLLSWASSAWGVGKGFISSNSVQGQLVPHCARHLRAASSLLERKNSF